MRMGRQTMFWTTAIGSESQWIFQWKGEMHLSSECCLGNEGYSQGELESRLGNLQQGMSGVRVLANVT